jgi:hypothetical protein
VADGSHVDVVAAHPVFLVSTNRRQGDRRGAGQRMIETPVFDLPLASQLDHTGGSENGDQGGVGLMERPQVRSQPATLAAGPRAATYVAVPGARLGGQTGQAAKVFGLIATAGQSGRTSAELRKDLKLKAKSLESVLYRLRLAGLIKAYDAREVRG